MALTKVSRGLLTTSIVDNGNATAITIAASGATTLSSTLAVTGAATVGGLTVNTGSYGAVGAGSGRMYGSTTHGLVIQGNGTTNDFLFLGSDGSDSFRIANNGDISFYNSSGTSQSLYWDSSAESLGIGTSSPSAGAVGGKVIHVQNSGGTASVRVDRSDAATSGTLSMTSANGSNGLFSTGAKPLVFATNSTERMRIDGATGNVGIGVAPNTGWNVSYRALQVGVSGALWSNMSSPALLLSNNTAFNVNGSRYRLAAGAAAELYLTGGGNFDFRTTATSGGANSIISDMTSKMTLSASGNLLVGKTVGNSPSTIGFEIQQDGEVYSTIASGFNTYHVYANSGYRFYVNPNGGLYNYSANNVNLSDKREKKNIEALESQWDSLKQWSLKKFHYNADDNSDTKKLGVIAQEVEVHNPELISEFSVDEDTTRMAVKEQQMVWMAIKALQEAQTRIETLEAKVQELENN